MCQLYSGVGSGETKHPSKMRFLVKSDRAGFEKVESKFRVAEAKREVESS